MCSKKAAWLADIVAQLGHGKPLFMVLYAALIIFFAFFYTAVVFNPDETADNLKKYGGFVPGIRPGKNTADYFDFVLTRLTVLGAGLSRRDLSVAGISDEQGRGSVLSRRHIAADRR